MSALGSLHLAFGIGLISIDGRVAARSAAFQSRESGEGLPTGLNPWRRENYLLSR
jgi:hypothetical protein